jgi:predicted enzyme related to lactoylglutathione lyase
MAESRSVRQAISDVASSNRASPAPDRRSAATWFHTRQTDGPVAEERRLVAVILEVADLARSTALYQDAFGVELRSGDNQVDDRWTGGLHSEISWRDGAYLHFALYPAKGQPTSGVQISLSVNDIENAHAVAVRAGARVLHGPRNEPWGRSGRYEDFDGNVIELTQHT